MQRSRRRLKRRCARSPGGLNVKNADERRKVKLNKQVYLSEEFRALWERIKYRTTYRVDFDIDGFVDACAKEIRDNLVVGKTRFIYEETKLDITQGGVDAGEVRETAHVYGQKSVPLPDIVSYLQNETNLTRRTLVDILIKSGKLERFKNNPQKFIDKALEIIKKQMQQCIVEGIRYRKLGSDFYYAQELFKEEEMYGYLSKNMAKVKKSVYDHVIYDSDVEQTFVNSFERNTDVKVYAKLPSWFKIDTPLGSYNPDWAVMIEEEDSEKLYFVVESKGSLFDIDRRGVENGKIACRREHFKAMGNGVRFEVCDSFLSFAERFEVDTHGAG